MSQLRAAFDNAFKAASNNSLGVNYIATQYAYGDYNIGNYFSVDIGVFALNMTQDSLVAEVRCEGFGSMHRHFGTQYCLLACPSHNCNALSQMARPALSMPASCMWPTLLRATHPPASSNPQVNHVLRTEPNISSGSVMAGLNSALLNYRDGFLSVAELSNLQVGEMRDGWGRAWQGREHSNQRVLP